MILDRGQDVRIYPPIASKEERTQHATLYILSVSCPLGD